AVGAPLHVVARPRARRDLARELREARRELAVVAARVRRPRGRLMSREGDDPPRAPERAERADLAFPRRAADLRHERARLFEPRARGLAHAAHAAADLVRARGEVRALHLGRARFGDLAFVLDEAEHVRRAIGDPRGAWTRARSRRDHRLDPGRDL